MRTPPTTAVLLAAGEGRRLGLGPKALLPMDGVPLVQTMVSRLLAGGCADVLVVTGAGADGVGAAARSAGARPVRCLGWESGMAASLRTGVAAALDPAPSPAAGPSASRLLLTLVDQPGLSAALIARVLGAHRPGRVAAAAYRHADGTLRRGHPVLLEAADARAAAAGARGDRGARDWLAAHEDRIDLVDGSDLDDGGDVDTPADLPRLGARSADAALSRGSAGGR